MAGARIELDITTPSLGQAAERLPREGLRLLLADIGEYLLASTRVRAARQVAPDDTPWRALSPRYKRWKDQKRPGLPILKFDYHMLGDRFSFQVDGKSVLVGTSAKYGAIHQFGGSVKIAARQQQLYFRRDARSGAVGNLFVKRRRSNFAQSVTMPASAGRARYVEFNAGAGHRDTLPARLRGSFQVERLDLARAL